MRVHLLGYPHTETTAEYVGCAYTSKVRKAATMFTRAGHEVFLYAGEHNDAECALHVTLLKTEERERWFGRWDPNVMPDVGWDCSDPWWRLFNARAIVGIVEHAQEGDLILLSTSWAQKPVADAFPGLQSVEYGVGYEGITGSFYCAYESYAWMHHVYGLHGIKDGRNFDSVIPNFFDPGDFPLLNEGRGDYLVYLGRVTPRKGVQEAIEIAGAAGRKLVVAGPSQSQRGGVDEVDLSASHVEYVGPVGVAERAELLAGARALICPTKYIEPFGGVAVEAMFAGTPVIASDYGAFTETVIPHVTGYRVRTLAEGVQAVEDVGGLIPAKVRAHAVLTYSLDRVAPLYTAWFERLQTLWGDGWYALADNSKVDMKETVNA